MNIDLTNSKTQLILVIIVLVLFAIIYICIYNKDLEKFTTYTVTTGDTVSLPNLDVVKLGASGTSFSSSFNNLLPAFTVTAYYGTDVPSGWQLCDGNELVYSDTKTPVLDINYNKILTPNLQGRVVIGCSGNNKSPAAIKDINNKNLSTNYYIGNSGGEEKHTLLINEIPSHSHSYYALVNNAGWWSNGYSNTGFSPNQWWPLAPNNNNGASDQTGKTGGNQSTPTVTDSHNNLQPYYVLMYIIKQPLSTSNSIAINVNQALPSV